MNVPKYYLTYCVMDTDAGASPFGHSCLLFSTQKTDTSSVQVVDSFGFYSQPSSTTNPVLTHIKKILSVNVDLQDGHGVLIQERIRDINANGLQGISFSVTEEQFKNVLNDAKNNLKIEQEAIKELNAELLSKGIEPNGYTRHIAEKTKAIQRGEKPRLKPFHVAMKLTLDGFDSSDSYTCKDRSLEFLTQHGVINTHIKEQIMCSKATHAFPRFSALTLPPIRLISTGEPERHISKKSKTVYYNHAWGKNELFWASPIYSINEAIMTKDESQIEQEYRLIKKILHRINKVEELLRHKINDLDNTMNNREYLTQLQSHLNQVQHLNVLFSNSYENQIPYHLNAKLAQAEKQLNCAIMSLNPERINYSFMLRAYESASAYNALLGALAVLLSIGVALVSPAIGIALLTTNIISTARQLHGFYKEEATFAKMKYDYQHTLLPQFEG